MINIIFQLIQGVHWILKVLGAYIFSFGQANPVYESIKLRGDIYKPYAGAQDIGIDVLEYDEGCFSFLVEGVDLFILLRSSLVIIFPLVGVFLEFDDRLVILRLGESTPPPDEEAMEGVADPALCL